MEAKLPDELFSKTTVLSANAKPMDDHPTEPVTAAIQYSKGMTHNDAHVLDNKLLVSFDYRCRDNKKLTMENVN